MSATLTRLATTGLRPIQRHSAHQTSHHITGPSNTTKCVSRKPYSTGRPVPNSERSQKHEEPEMMPKADFKAMFQGASPLVKGVVYTMVGVIGTVETYTYSLWIWHYFYPKPRSDVVEEDAGGDGGVVVAGI